MVLSILRLVGCCIYLGVLRRQPHRRSGLATMPSVGATIQYNIRLLKLDRMQADNTGSGYA